MKKTFLCLGIAVFLTVGCGPGNMASKVDGWEGHIDGGSSFIGGPKF